VPDERIIQQVSGILSMNDVPFQTSGDKQSFLVPMGSAGVMVSFVDHGEHTLVGLRAIVLEQVDSSGERKQTILEALNEKNKSAFLGTFYFDAERGLVVFDHHLLGDDLQSGELVFALALVGTIADTVDDELREAIGSGVRASDAWNAAQVGATDPQGVGPVVET
jgi:hypothetical protein